MRIRSFFHWSGLLALLDDLEALDLDGDLVGAELQRSSCGEEVGAAHVFAVH